ncbi:MAG: ABC transporter substrate-binding protein, partial [Nitrospinales bacterium]|nr:ABC transporter substrate-binding protein [Nitrospinales bacterium]
MAFLKSQGEVSKMKLKSIILAFVFFIITAVQAQAADTIKVGILHSLSGTMAISETSLRDVALMAIEE